MTTILEVHVSHLVQLVLGGGWRWRAAVEEEGAYSARQCNHHRMRAWHALSTNTERGVAPRPVQNRLISAARHSAAARSTGTHVPGPLVRMRSGQSKMTAHVL